MYFQLLIWPWLRETIFTTALASFKASSGENNPPRSKPSAARVATLSCEVVFGCFYSFNKRRRSQKKPAFLVIISIIVAIGLVGGIIFWLIKRQYVSTTDADAGYIHAYGGQNVKLPPGGSAGGDPPGTDPNDASFDDQLSTLLARQPDALSAELEAAKPLPPRPPIIPIGLPSQLLERRPDIRAAERQIAAATANIGAAKADLFLKFTLTSDSMGLDSTSVQNWFDWQSRYFLISPTITWRIFGAGRIFSNIRLQKTRRQANLVEALHQSGQSLLLARQQYEHGLSNFLTVLDAERSVLSVQDELARSNESVCRDLVALYKALGGGWQTGVHRKNPARQ
jgi:Outer membrane efflux protein